jgi:large subunit ribosomal protein L10
MALSKSQKQAIVSELDELLSQSKMTVVVKYQGTSVKALQELRKNAKDNGTKVKVVKNRLVKQALKNNSKLSKINTDLLEGMLMYAFNNNDEVAAAQVLNSFMKQNPNMEFVGAITQDGLLIEAEKVKELALLPNRDELLAGIINILNSPIKKVSASLNNSLVNIISSLEVKATN